MNKDELIHEIDISLIDDFNNHPFKVVDDREMNALEESILSNGILVPIVVRKKDNNRYEMLSGHRRKYACTKLGLKKIKTIIKDLTDEEATIFMVDSNLQRDRILPSEKAFAYKMKYEALKKQRKNTLRQVVATRRSDDLLGKDYGDSGRKVQRYLRLTHLIPELLQMVDNLELKKSPSIAITPASVLSYLSKKEQNWLLEFINYNLSTPSHSQSIKLKELSQKGLLTKDVLNDILSKEKPNQVLKFKINENKLLDVVPKNIEREKIEEFVLKACKHYSKHLKLKGRESR